MHTLLSYALYISLDRIASESATMPDGSETLGDEKRIVNICIAHHPFNRDPHMKGAHDEVSLTAAVYHHGRLSGLHGHAAGENDLHVCC